MRSWILTFIFVLTTTSSVLSSQCNFLLKDTFRGFITQVKPTMLIVIHGGLSSMNRAYQMCETAQKIAPEGVGIASLDFSPSTLGGKEVEEAIFMANWLKEQGAKRIGLMGKSHGAYIALMVAPHIKPTFLIDIAGPTDLRSMFGYFKSHREKFKDWIRVIEATKRKCKDKGKEESLCMEELSPVSYAGFMEFPVLIIHGTEDQIIPLHQSLKLLGKLLTFKNHKVWLFAYPAEHDIDFTISPVKDVIKSFFQQIGGVSDGMSGSDTYKKEHKEISGQASGEGKDNKGIRSSPLGSLREE